jgi:opacity protein-like surface antigen
LNYKTLLESEILFLRPSTLMMILILFLAILVPGAAARAQSSSSSSQPAPAQKTTPTDNPRWFVQGAAGGALATGLDGQQYMNAGWTGMGGAGYVVTRRLSVDAELDYFHNGVPTPALQAAAQNSGHYNTIAFSANPMLYIVRGKKFGFYVIGGGGYSRISASFGKPLSSINCNIYSPLGYANYTNFCNGKITGSSYSSSQPMFDVGMGFEGRLYPNRRWVLFVEPRYMRMMTPANQLPGQNLGMAQILGGIRW